MRLGELAHLDVGSRPVRKKFNDDPGGHGGRGGGYEAGGHEDVGPAGDFAPRPPRISDCPTHM